jgi:hypothetical protein
VYVPDSTKADSLGRAELIKKDHNPDFGRLFPTDEEHAGL